MTFTALYNQHVHPSLRAILQLYGQMTMAVLWLMTLLLEVYFAALAVAAFVLAATHVVAVALVTNLVVQDQYTAQTVQVLNEFLFISPIDHFGYLAFAIVAAALAHLVRGFRR